MAMATLKVLSLLTLTFAAVCSESTGVERPCGAAEAVDVECVRTQLAARSGCTPVSGGAGLDPYYPPEVCIYSNTFNITIRKVGNTYRNLSGSIVTDFAVDNDNNVTIISLRHPYLNLTGPLDICFEKINRASLKVATVFQDQYTNLLTWTLIPGTTSLDLNKRQTHYYLTTEPTITFGDANLQSYIDSDPLVAATVKAISADVKVIAYGSLYSMSKVFAEAIIGLNLCSLSEREPLFQDYTL